MKKHDLYKLAERGDHWVNYRRWLPSQDAVADLHATVLALDPPFGTQGQAATARNLADRWRGRPRNQDAYPIFRCSDGYVRICVLSPRQWRGMRAWLGEPAQFQDPAFDTIAARTKAFGELGALKFWITMRGSEICGMSMGISVGNISFCEGK